MHLFAQFTSTALLQNPMERAVDDNLQPTFPLPTTTIAQQPVGESSLPRPISRPHTVQPSVTPPPSKPIQQPKGIYDKVVMSLQAHFPSLPR